MMQASLHCATEMKGPREGVQRFCLTCTLSCVKIKHPRGDSLGFRGKLYFLPGRVGPRDQEPGVGREGRIRRKKRQTERGREGGGRCRVGGRERRGAAGVRRSLVECSYLADRQPGAMVEPQPQVSP